MNAENLPLTKALARFGDVPTSFVMREMMFERDYRELENWVSGRLPVGTGLSSFGSRPQAVAPLRASIPIAENDR
jgi:hypothetical protein